MVVAIDGPAGVGKSTVAHRVARQADFLYLNSGDFYRSITLAALDSGLDPQDPESVVRAAREIRFELTGGGLTINRRPADGRLHSDRVDRWVSLHSAIPEVRRIVNTRLREISASRDIVVEGRDIGTEVFPKAELKVFLDARLEVRARRRRGQGTSSLSLDQIRRQMQDRDQADRDKPIGSLKKSPDALYVDTTDLTIDQVCERLIREIHAKRENIERKPGDKHRQ